MSRDKLNKTDILAVAQCPKRAYLRVHHPQLGTPSKSPALITGRIVGTQARHAFPGGVLIDRFVPGADSLAHTRAAMADVTVAAVFEAGFEVGGVRVFVDVLQRAASAWVLIEVKSGSRVKDEHIDDVAVQAWVLRQTGVEVSRYEVMHIDSAFEYAGDGDYDGLFVREDVTERVLAAQTRIAAQILSLHDLLRGDEPKKRIARQCSTPVDCEFYTHCAESEPTYPLIDLPRITQHKIDEFHAQNIFDVRDIPIDALNSEKQLWVREVTRRGVADVKPGAAAALAPLAYPRYYLDFECVQFAVPIWTGTRPFEQLPFQWSCHVEHRDGTLTHREFLDTSSDDPRRAFAHALIDACGDRGVIVVYHANFERSVINALTAQFADLAPALAALRARLFDLQPVVERHYYHPDMRGHWSIKNVLPCLAPDLSYAQLGSVKDGTQAQQAYLDIIAGNGGVEERDQWRDDLLRYCKLDTYAMVRIARALRADFS